METIHVTFDELTEQPAPGKSSSGPVPNLLSPGPISSGLVQNPTPASPFVPPTSEDWKKLFDRMFDENFEPQNVAAPEAPVIPKPAGVANVPHVNAGPSTSLSWDPEAPTISHSVTTSNVQSSSVQRVAAVDNSFEVNPFAPPDDEPFVNFFAPESSNDATSSEESNTATSIHYPQPHEDLRKWTNDHPIDNIIGNPSRPVSTRKQLAIDALWCFFNSVLSEAEPKDFKDAMSKH
jgi:hypothetical protein